MVAAKDNTPPADHFLSPLPRRQGECERRAMASTTSSRSCHFRCVPPLVWGTSARRCRYTCTLCMRVMTLVHYVCAWCLRTCFVSENHGVGVRTYHTSKISDTMLSGLLTNFFPAEAMTLRFDTALRHCCCVSVAPSVVPPSLASLQSGRIRRKVSAISWK